MPNLHKFKYLNDLDCKAAAGLKKKVFDQMKRDFILGEPLTVSYPSERQLVFRWMINREAYLVKTHVDRALKDAVAFGVSKTNQCPFCAESHAMMVAATGHREEARKIRRSSGQDDNQLIKVTEWARQSLDPSADLVQSPPFSKEEAPELIGTFYCFNVTNRLVNIFLGENPLPVSKDKKLLYSIMSFVATRFMLKPAVTKKLEPGESITLISIPEEGPTPAWTKEVKTASNAFQAMVRHVGEIEEELIPQPVAERVDRILENWNGQPWPPRGEWLNDQADGVGPSEQPLLKLALLVMFASYSVTHDDITAFRKFHPDDRSLIDLCYWAANKVSLRILDWVASPFALDPS